MRKLGTGMMVVGAALCCWGAAKMAGPIDVVAGAFVLLLAGTFLAPAFMPQAPLVVKTEEEIQAILTGRLLAADMKDFRDLQELERENASILVRNQELVDGALELVRK